MFVFPMKLSKSKKIVLSSYAKASEDTPSQCACTPKLDEAQRAVERRCGPERARTADLLLAKQALYQLSYRPERGLTINKNGGPKRNCTSDPSVISTVLY